MITVTKAAPRLQNNLLLQSTGKSLLTFQIFSLFDAGCSLGTIFFLHQLFPFLSLRLDKMYMKKEEDLYPNLLKDKIEM